MKRFWDLLSDKSPTSSLRLIQLTFFTFFSLGWVAVTAKNWAMADIPPGLQVTIGLLLGGKVLQKGIEVYQDQVTPK